MADWLDVPYSIKGKRVWVAGHNGLVGRAVCRRLEPESCEVLSVARQDLDLTDQSAVFSWMSKHEPDVVILTAAKVGGIRANMSYPAQFLYKNLMIEANVIHGAYECGVEKLLFLGSSCIYPRDAAIPIEPEALLTGPLEETNEAYALAKILGLKLCAAYKAQYGCDFIAAMPCNIYGPYDSLDEKNAHVIPALLMRALRAKEDDAQEFQIWGSGKPLREFLYADDLADGLVFILQHYSGAMPVNIGSGEEVSILDLAIMILDAVGLSVPIVCDTTKPDGVHRKLISSDVIRARGWFPHTSIREGLERTSAWYEENLPDSKNLLF